MSEPKAMLKSTTVKKDLLMGLGSAVLAAAYGEPAVQNFIAAHPWVIAAVGNILAAWGIKLRWGTNRKLTLK